MMLLLSIERIAKQQTYLRVEKMKNQRKKGVDVIEHPGKTSTTSVSQQKKFEVFDLSNKRSRMNPGGNPINDILC